MLKRWLIGIALIFAVAGRYIPLAAAQDMKNAGDAEKARVEKKERGPLTDDSRIILIKGIVWELAKSRKHLPGGKSKDGIRIRVYFDEKSGKYAAKLDEEALNKEVVKNGSSILPNDDVQITLLEIKGKEIVAVLNGGLKKKGSWRDHIQFGIGGRGMHPPVTTTTIDDRDKKEGLANKPGSMVVLDFGRYVPDITPADVKELLDSILDFSNQKSAAEQEKDKWSPEVRLAVTENRAIVGMNAVQVVEALHRKDYKESKERNDKDEMVITWIFGKYPDLFMVEFNDESGSETYGKVICIREGPNFSECKQTSKPSAIQPVDQ